MASPCAASCEAIFSANIEKGSFWPIELIKELESVKVGLLCFTKDNLNAPWILFEAGAMLKQFAEERVCPILFDDSRPTYNPDEHQIEFTADVILSGEQDPDKGRLGTRLSVELSGTIKREDETWFVDSYEINSCELVD